MTQIPTGPQQEIQSDTPTPAISEGLPQPDAQPQAQPQPQAQSAPQALAATPAAPSKPGSFFHNISHAFMGAVLGQAVDDGKRTGGIGGETMAVTDPATGQYSIHPRPMSVSQRMAGLSSRILSGLASVPDSAENPSPIKGLGQGFVAAQKAKSDIVDKEHAQESENFKTEQEQKMQKFDLAYKNAATLRLGMETVKMRNDLNPMIPESRATMEAVKSSPELAGLQVQEVNDQQRQDMMKDGHFTGSMILPLGSQPVLDPQTGEPMLNADGSVKTEQKWGVIGGDPKLMKNGKFVIPSTIADEIKQFGPKAIGPSAASFTAGTELPLGQFVKIMGAVDNERAKVVAGWNVPTIAYAADGKTPMFVNSYDSAQPPRPISYLTPGFKADEAKMGKEKSEEAKNYGEAKEHAANAALIMSGLGQSPVGSPQWKATYDAGQAELAQLPPERRAGAIAVMHEYPGTFPALMAASNGDVDADKLRQTRAKGPGIAGPKLFTTMKILNPDYFEGMYKAKQELLKSFGSSRDGQAIDAFNNFAGHLGQMRTYASQLQQSNSPMLNMTIQEAQKAYAGRPELNGLMVSVVGPRDEWMNIIKNGHAADVAETAESQTLLNPASTIGQMINSGTAMSQQAITRLGNLDQRWQRIWGHGGHFPSLITPEAAAALESYGLGAEIAPYTREGAVGGVRPTAGAVSPSSGQPAQTPSPATKIFDMAAFAKANPGADPKAAAAAAQAAGYEVKQ